MTRAYRYMTKDGQPPNKGTPPGVPRPGAGPRCLPAFTPQANMYAQPVTIPSLPGPPALPPAFCWLPAPAPATVPDYTPPPPPYPPCAPAAPPLGGFPPAPSPSTPTPIHGATNPAPGVQGGTGSSLPPGARIRGELPVFPNRDSGYIFGKKQCVFHIVEGRTKPWQSSRCEVKFTVAMADCRMPIKEFIEQVGAIKRAPPRASEESIGICEVKEVGDGTWLKASQFLLGDSFVKLTQSLADVGWDEFRGEAAMGQPVWLVLMP